MSALAPSGSGSKYSDEDRRQAIAEYAIHGTLSKTSEYTGIPQQTLSDWAKNEWWQDAVREVRLQNKEVIESKYEQIILKGLDAQLERLSKGDPYVTKGKDEDGSYVETVAYKPVSYRDLSTGNGIGFDKLRLIRNEPTSIKAESTDARLNSLAEKVRELQGGMVTIDQEGNKIP